MSEVQVKNQESCKVSHVLAMGGGKAVAIGHATWGTPLLYYAFYHEVESLAAELSNPHVDDGHLARDDGEGSI